MSEKINIQESKELEYFQKIQIQKQEIKSLKMTIGQLQAEIDHLNYLLKKSEEPASNAKKWKRKYDDLVYQVVKSNRNTDEEILKLINKL